jgi:predicted nuclease of predicted toxin-antitoxin system
VPSVRGSCNGSRCTDGGMRLLIDAQPPPALARWFVSKGHDAAHVFGIEFHRSSDEEIWKFALDNDLILVTKDEDFSSRVWIDQASVGLIWVTIGNCSNRTLIGVFEEKLAAIERRFSEGKSLVRIQKKSGN